MYNIPVAQRRKNMDYIEKLFKQYPFIYCIGGKYYALGTGVCSECDMRSVLLESRYRKFEESIDQNLKTEDAWKIFHKLISEADYVKDENGVCCDPQKEILKFEFSEKEMNELKAQVERYVAYWRKYSFNTFLH